MFAGDDSIITAINGNALTIGGTLFANADAFGSFASPSVTGNLLRLTANGTGSTLTVGGDVFLSAAAMPATTAKASTPATRSAERSSSRPAAGARSTSPAISTSTSTAMAATRPSVRRSGDGTGGTAHILANGGSGSSLTVGGPVNVSANGTGRKSTVECSSCHITGGNGTGGTILLQALVGSGNQLNLDGDVDA